MEFVLIINLEPKIATDLNTRRPDHPDANKREGLNIKSIHSFRELNNCDKLHGSIQSRVFYAKDVNQGDRYSIELLGYKSITKNVPNDKEYEIIDFKN